MIRNDTYALYQGKEYRIVSSDEKGKYELISRNNLDLLNGFFSNNKGNGYFRKKISLDEVETVYSIKTFCIYKGLQFDVLTESSVDSNEILIEGENGRHPVSQLISWGFEMVDRGVYDKTVTRDEVERIFEVKETKKWFLEETNRIENTT